ncbi:hypothetical protein BYT27DRAFT_7265732 [Phlegmacium glaucopus]|nr:hypothetical protein BYT27DRAFT_7265732 [Phlegmacium glaucopus]
MTEVGGPLFHSNINNPQGWYAHECLVPGAELSLINEQGRDAARKIILTFIVTSFLIKVYCKGLGSDGSITFQTGDIYGRSGDRQLVWKDHKEDYIQMSSDESIDPRVIKAALDQCPATVQSCIVGNNFLKTSSQVIRATIEPSF